MTRSEFFDAYRFGDYTPIASATRKAGRDWPKVLSFIARRAPEHAWLEIAGGASSDVNTVKLELEAQMLAVAPR